MMATHVRLHKLGRGRAASTFVRSSVRSSFPRAFRHACHMLTARERPRSSENIMMVVVIVCRPAMLAIGRRVNAEEPERSKQILRRFSGRSRIGRLSRVTSKSKKRSAAADKAVRYLRCASSSR